MSPADWFFLGMGVSACIAIGLYYLLRAKP